MGAGSSNADTEAKRVGAADQIAQDGHQPTIGRTTEQVWRHLAKASFAVVSHVTPAGEPRSSGVLVRAIGQRL